MKHALFTVGTWLLVVATAALMLATTYTCPTAAPCLVVRANQYLFQVSGVNYGPQAGLVYTKQADGSYVVTLPAPPAAGLAIQSGGMAIGNATTLNVVGGIGTICVPQVNAGVLTLQCNADPAYVAWNSRLQGAGSPVICTSTSSDGGAYAASCPSPLPAYQKFQALKWNADVSNAITNPTLNIDTLGKIPLVRKDGSPLAIGDINAGEQYNIWFDGVSFRVVEAGIEPAA